MDTYFYSETQKNNGKEVREILTNNGWKSFTDIVNDEVYKLTGVDDATITFMSNGKNVIIREEVQENNILTERKITFIEETKCKAWSTTPVYLTTKISDELIQNESTWLKMHYMIFNTSDEKVIIYVVCTDSEMYKLPKNSPIIYKMTTTRDIKSVFDDITLITNYDIFKRELNIEEFRGTDACPWIYESTVKNVVFALFTMLFKNVMERENMDDEYLIMSPRFATDEDLEIINLNKIPDTTSILTYSRSLRLSTDNTIWGRL